MTTGRKSLRAGVTRKRTTLSADPFLPKQIYKAKRLNQNADDSVTVE
jgi:hypothetical protein